MNTQQTTVDAPVVVQQTRLEFETLGHIKNALKTAVKADAVGDDLARKLASVRFVTTSLQRYVERMFALEEYDGYMNDLRDTYPHLLQKVDHLHDEHDVLRERLRRIITRLELLANDDVRPFDVLCQELLALIARLDHHTRMETELLEEAYLQDTGGEGGS